MKKRDKKAVLFTKETIEFILAVALIALIIFLLYLLISPYFDKDEEISKSYIETLGVEIKKADGGGIGEFQVWQDKIHLIYFNKNPFFITKIGNRNQAVSFIAPGWDRYYLCACYVYKGDEKTHCDACMSLNKQAEYETQKNSWIVWAGTRVYIRIIEGKYYFSKFLSYAYNEFIDEHAGTLGILPGKRCWITFDNYEIEGKKSIYYVFETDKLSAGHKKKNGEITEEWDYSFNQDIGTNELKQQLKDRLKQECENPFK
jgi:hypothetical protein